MLINFLYLTFLLLSGLSKSAALKNTVLKKNERELTPAETYHVWDEASKNVSALFCQIDSRVYSESFRKSLVLEANFIMALFQQKRSWQPLVFLKFLRVKVGPGV